ncbi:hypothetical protein EVAR_52399_1 [Eumeta japonica]|uniref:Uncharacterized protein n=1 Tax=Eumeta variegata TaxID=151549 RepID=A0A4C1ZH89_EUMVA|nr:hypothetical protein EVAR_52399_1 [Eumeta japonica]
MESGSAKRKEKAERTASNQALSLNMMKFLNQTASDALSTESELQLDVELGSCSSQSKMDTEILCCHQQSRRTGFRFSNSQRRRQCHRSTST